MDVALYLRILKVENPKLDLLSLRKIIRAHYRHISVENISTRFESDSPPWNDMQIFKTCIQDNRGGLPCQLNFAFYLLLRQLGFDIILIADRTGAPFLIIKVAGQQYLVSVGNIDSFESPLLFSSRPQLSNFRYYALEVQEDTVVLKKSSDGLCFETINELFPKSKSPVEFLSFYDKEIDKHKKSGLEELFAYKTTATGKNRIENKRLICQERGERSEHHLFGQGDLQAKFSQHFQAES